MTFQKYHYCSICEDETLCTVKGEISFPPVYAIGAPPGPDVVRTDSGSCERGHELPLGEAEEIMGDIAAGDVL